MSKDSENEIIEIEDTPQMIGNQDVMLQQEVTPMVMMQQAIAQGSDVAVLERLWALNEKVEAANAKKAYVSAMAKFKQNPPEIEKDKLVRYQNSDGSWTEYRHASLGNVVDKITERLGEYGFSHSWNIEQLEGGQIRVTCIVTHEGGHSEQVSMSSSRDDSGKKNNIQQLSSTVTYLERYTLLAATGSATVEGDDDGRTAEPQPEIELITEEQANALHARLTENGVKMERFMKWIHSQFNIEHIEEIPAVSYEKVNNKVTATIKAQQEKTS